jgi:hypothetical protein
MEWDQRFLEGTRNMVNNVHFHDRNTTKPIIYYGNDPFHPGKWQAQQGEPLFRSVVKGSLEAYFKV